jgi:tRNA(Ile)-lysidine synthase
MYDTIRYILQRECKLHAMNLVLVGVSGGPDSIYLLDILNNLGYPLIAAHLNHGLRPEAATDALVVQLQTEKLGVPFVMEQVDTLAYAEDHSISIEEAARKLRYHFLFHEAIKAGARVVAVAHTADDQVETVLMHLLRGSGLAGLRGMEYRTCPTEWNNTIPLVRPLLSTWRSVILKYCVEHELNTVIDQSNYDTAYLRNRIRHDLLPLLETYNPRFRQSLLRSSQSLAGDYDLIQRMTSLAWSNCLIKQGSGYLVFDLASYQELPLALQRNLLRQAIAYHRPGLRDVDFEHIERGLAFLFGPKPNTQIDLVAGLRLFLEGDEFWLTTWEADLPISEWPVIKPGEQFTLSIPGELILRNEWELEAEDEPDVDEARRRVETNQDPFQAWMDASELELPLIVRARHRGDRFLPLGMGGHSMKLSDLMINLKLPNRARATWPLVCSGEKILWVPGFRLSHLARIKPTTPQVVHLRVIHSSST